MAAFPTSQHFKALTFLILFLKTLAADPISLFSFAEFQKDPKFNSSVALFGNAKVVNGGYGVQLSGSAGSGAGRVMYKKPIKLVEGKPPQLVSFSTYFASSILLENVDGLAFVITPSSFEGDVFESSTSEYSSGWKKRKSVTVAVEFSASKDARNGGSLDYNMAINLGNLVPAKIGNSSFANLGLRNGEKVHAWIDYLASSKRLEVRLSRYGRLRPTDPLLWHSIDFTNMWEEKDIFVGFKPVKGNSSQTCFIYSWSFMLRDFPHWMHSEPLDPKKAVGKNTEPLTGKPRSDCILRVLAAMIFGAGCGALTAFIVLYLWTIFGNRRPVAPEEYVVQPVDFEYKKVQIVVDNAIKDGKK
ncbi:hypothetical protein L6164_003470 [Bauhinia variegata]|uniref:Uncharacterized protein n=1 Tax=Bauhinia variegata TaxID=167791 RepID=A0ACB9Q1E9_BAUVA|nr:hypothetical protein L6164_003470 [Bauhinia variegata]